MSAEDRLYNRLEELRCDLVHANPERRAYAREALLSLLWVETGRKRLAIACALCDSPPQTGKAEAPPCAVRLSARLSREPAGEDLPPPPKSAELAAWAGQAVAAVLTEALDTLKAVTRAQPEQETPVVFREAEVCRDALCLAARMQLDAAVPGCVRLLRLFPAEQGRETVLQARWTTILREAAARTLGALSPDALFPFWYALGSPEVPIRRSLLPALDYLQDPRAVRYLIHLLERRGQWPDGEMVGWFVVRAFERIGDRSALPALRRVAAGERSATSQGEGASTTSPELAREARRVIQAIEGQRKKREHDALLRPADPLMTGLLRSAIGTVDTEEDRDELLRPENQPPITNS